MQGLPLLGLKQAKARPPPARPGAGCRVAVASLQTMVLRAGGCNPSFLFSPPLRQAAARSGLLRSMRCDRGPQGSCDQGHGRGVCHHTKPRALRLRNKRTRSNTEDGRKGATSTEGHMRGSLRPSSASRAECRLSGRRVSRAPATYALRADAIQALTADICATGPATRTLLFKHDLIVRPRAWARD